MVAIFKPRQRYLLFFILFNYRGSITLLIIWNENIAKKKSVFFKLKRIGIILMLVTFTSAHFTTASKTSNAACEFLFLLHSCNLSNMLRHKT